ncbi:nucleotidyl transferase AbiEii/AbiGii toxin family protein [Acrocarpospora sp. B8E8]|uniref:nucleotidyl transferase AbiEii/AbiGii toxin family protein n=1 Tax=Acrocarpospora sp. B8E8 TaxID=3153572 RepID=UPI00325DF71A
MLEPGELAAVTAAFGVAEPQVRRDHLISHVLAALAHLDGPCDTLVFFGGTALARTHLPNPADGGRLSEDIDLWTDNRATVAAFLETQLPRALRREFPRTRWEPALTAVRSAIDPAQLVTADGLRLRIQLLDTGNAHREWTRWPTEQREIHVRYSDVGPTRLRVPTVDAFTAMKLAAWADRRAARDLYDLAALARAEKITEASSALFRDMIGYSVSPALFQSRPAGDWEAQLAHQTAHLPSPAECLADIRGTYAALLGWPSSRDSFT